MLLNKKKTIAFTLFILSVLPGFFLPVFAATDAPQTREDLEKQIQDKAKQLETLNQAIQSTQSTLKDVQVQKNTLQSQVKTLDNSLKQLDLSIQSDQVTTQKVTLEMQNLGYDIKDIESSITDNKAAIEELFRELQKASNESTLITLLGNKTLAEGLAETQSVDNIRAQLSTDIESLKELHAKYRTKIGNLSEKKVELVTHQQTLADRKQIAADVKQERSSLLAQTKDKESLYQKQLSDLQKLQESIANEIEALDAQLRSKVDPKLLPPVSSGVLGLPISGTMASQTKGCGLQNCTQGYGSTSFAKNGYRGKWHNGIDFGIPVGTQVFSAEDGIVLATGNEDTYCPRGAYGKFILIKHNNNLTTLYGHLSKFAVTPGQTVKRGQFIGYSGKTGYATGPHLHFTVFATPTIPPAAGKNPEGITWSKSCGPLPIGGDLNPLGYL